MAILYAVMLSSCMYVHCAVHRGFKKLTELFILKVYPGAKMKNEVAQKELYFFMPEVTSVKSLGVVCALVFLKYIFRIHKYCSIQYILYNVQLYIHHISLCCQSVKTKPNIAERCRNVWRIRTA